MIAGPNYKTALRDLPGPSHLTSVQFIASRCLSVFMVKDGHGRRKRFISAYLDRSPRLCPLLARRGCPCLMGQPVMKLVVELRRPLPVEGAMKQRFLVGGLAKGLVPLLTSGARAISTKAEP